MKRKIEMGILGVRPLLHSNSRYGEKNTTFSLFRAANGGLESGFTRKMQKYGGHLERVRSGLVFRVCFFFPFLKLFSFSATSNFRAATHSDRR